MPVAHPTRRVSYHLKEKVIEKIKELEKLDIIEERDGPTDWVSPLMVSPKRDGDIRIIINMRENEAILRDRHPIPTLEQLKQEMGDVVLFSKLDLKMGHHQLELDENFRPITTFSTPIELRKYKRLSPGNNISFRRISACPCTNYFTWSKRCKEHITFEVTTALAKRKRRS